MEEEYLLSKNDFGKSISKTFKNVMHDTAFADVTLACGGDVVLKAHKVILSGGSRVFRNILLSNSHQHPLLYLTGMNVQNLQAVIEFIYLGEARIPKSRVASFLETAKELKVEGLTERQEDDMEDREDARNQQKNAMEEAINPQMETNYDESLNISSEKLEQNVFNGSSLGKDIEQGLSQEKCVKNLDPSGQLLMQPDMLEHSDDKLAGEEFTNKEFGNKKLESLAHKESSYLEDDYMEEEVTFNENAFGERKIMSEKHEFIEDENIDDSLEKESSGMLNYSERYPEVKEFNPVPETYENSLDDTVDGKLGENQQDDLTEDMSEHVWEKYDDIDSYEEDFVAPEDIPDLNEEMSSSPEEGLQNFPIKSKSSFEDENLVTERKEEIDFTTKLDDNTINESNDESNGIPVELEAKEEPKMEKITMEDNSESSETSEEAQVAVLPEQIPSNTFQDALIRSINKNVENDVVNDDEDDFSTMEVSYDDSSMAMVENDDFDPTTKDDGEICDVCGFTSTAKTRHNRRMIVRKHKEMKHNATPKAPKLKEDPSGPKVYKCDKCDFTTAHYGSQKRHEISKHTDVRKFTCNHCDKSFIASYEMKRHMETKHGIPIKDH